MIQKKTVIILLFAFLIACLAYFYFFRKTNKSNDITVYGNVDVRQVNLSFRIAGLVKEIYFEEGDLVQPGDLVAILDTQPYFDQVGLENANIESIRASLTNAEILLKRRKELISDGSVSQEELDNALSNKTVLDANLKSAEAALAIAKINLGFTKIFAPVEGTILSRIREPGTVVNPTDPVYSLSVTSPVWIRAFIPEPFLGDVYPGMRAEIHTDTPNGKSYTGQVGFISPVAEFTPKTVETTQLRTDLVYRLRIYADNPDRGLRQGMPVTVKLLSGLEKTKKKPTLVEESAIPNKGIQEME